VQNNSFRQPEPDARNKSVKVPLAITFFETSYNDGLTYVTELHIERGDRKRGRQGREREMGGAVKVYGVVASPFVATVLLCLEETGVGYELVPVDMAAREQKTEPYLCRNVSFLSSSTIQMRNYCSLQ
jgi:hypothetical protein